MFKRRGGGEGVCVCVCEGECVCVRAVRAGGSFFLSKSDPQIILGAQIGVKGTRRSLEIAFYPLAFFFLWISNFQ